MKSNYNLNEVLKNDIASGIVVFFVALPLCLGVSLAAGAPLFSGIISGIVGGIVVGLISQSQLSVSGPSPAYAIIVLTALTTFKFFDAFLVCVILCGVFQIILGLIKAGKISFFIPNSVIKGMLAAIGIILILKQIPHAIGYDFDYEGDMDFSQKDTKNTFSEIAELTNYVNFGSILFAAISIGILLTWENKKVKEHKILKLIPGSLLVVITSILLNEFLVSIHSFLALKNEHLVQLPIFNTPGAIIYQINTPNLTVITNPKVWEFALMLTFACSLETLLSIGAADKLDPYNRITNPNKELFAQGIANILCGFIGGLPVAAVVVRTSANISAGAKTKFSTIIHGSLMLLSVLFLGKVLNKIPLASLSAILLLVGYKLSRIKLFKDSYKLGYDQFIPFAVTILGVVFFNLLKGVGLGVIVSVVFILRNNFKSPFTLKQQVIEGRQHYFIKLSQSVTFINKGKISEFLHSVPNDSEIFIDGGRASFIDKDVLEIISEFKHYALFKNIKVITEDIPDVEIISTTGK